MSALGLGLAALGRPAYINLGHGGDFEDRSVRGMERSAHAVLDAAFEHGVRHFDAARSYGRAEEFLASWLDRRGLGREEVRVSSKWGYAYTGRWKLDAEEHEVKELSAAQLEHQWRESSDLLGKWLVLYEIHSATIESGVLDDAAVRAQLAAIRAGNVAVGLTTTGTGQAETIDRALATGGFDAVQATWNLHERSAGDALGRASAAGMTIYVKEAVANGRLTARGAGRALIAAAAARRTTPDALALAAVLAQPWADVVLSGAATTEQLASNLGAARVRWDEACEEELAGLAEESAAYWAARSALAWN